MYLDLKRNRVLLMNGISLTTPEHMASLVFESGEIPDYLKLEDCQDSEAFFTIYDRDIGYEITDEDLIGPGPSDGDDVTLDEVFDLIANNSDRYVPSDEADLRIVEELTFFEESGNLVMLVRCWELIQRLLADGVVVGVGRGSACASYVLFLLGVHDVDPIKYDISFSELSKEVKSEFESEAVA